MKERNKIGKNQHCAKVDSHDHRYFGRIRPGVSHHSLGEKSASQKLLDICKEKMSTKVKKNRKRMWFIILVFSFIFSTGQVCTIWDGFGDG